MAVAAPARGFGVRAIAAASLGNALEFYDFLTYALFAVPIGRAFFPAGSAYASLMLSLATFGAGFLSRPLGAIVMGRYADRVGRKPAMLVSFGLIGGSMLLLALIPPYAAIGLAAPVLAVLARLAQGFSVGGEIGASTAFLLEAAPPAHRAFAASWQAAGQELALIVGSLVGAGLTALLPAAAMDRYGWRIALLLGVVTVPFGLWLRRHLPETLHAPTTAPPQTAAAPLTRVVLPAVAILAATAVGAYICLYAVTYAQTALHLSAEAGFWALLVNSVVGMAAALLGGHLADRFGRRPVYVLGNAASLLMVLPAFVWMVRGASATALIGGMAILGIATNLVFGAFLAGFAEALPRPVRSTVFGVVYSLALAVFGGATQPFVTWLIHITGSPMAPGWCLCAALAVSQVALMVFPAGDRLAGRPVPA